MYSNCVALVICYSIVFVSYFHYCFVTMLHYRCISDLLAHLHVKFVANKTLMKHM